MCDNPPVSRISNQAYLREAQYKTSVNLAARANLHRRFSANSYGWTKWAYDQLTLQPRMRVLEVGGGRAGCGARTLNACRLM